MRQSKLDFRLINVVGIDGSGKTNLCKALLHELQKNYPATEYVHSYHEPIILKPMKSMARAIFMQGTDEFANYSRYRERKFCTSNRHKYLSSVYGFVWILDYVFQALIRVGLLSLFGRRIIIDRYVFDTVINASLTANWAPGIAHRILGALLKILPSPNVVFLIDLPEIVAFERKKDIQSVEYLQERRHLYLKMADTYGFIKLDGQDEPRAILAKAMRGLA
jgi:dTMP kinase